MKVRGIFDIGKTNKKFFLFDESLKEVYRDYTRFEETQDDEGFPCDDVVAIKSWIGEIFRQVSQEGQFEIVSLNFSAYGASFVHLDKEGKVIAPLYNYLKPYPKDLLDSFHHKYGEELNLATETASPPLGMLNSGLQLYWLKHTHPEKFKKIRWSLHLPQYLSYLFTGIPLSEYTSVGCHTMLWDYEKGDYHRWVYAEGIDHILPPLVETGHKIHHKTEKTELSIGVGIHDSSAALLPYQKLSNDPFLLLSTGTWSISLNPFNNEALTQDQLQKDCLNFMGIKGNTVRASRLFLGNEYKIWARQLADHFHQPYEKHSSVPIDHQILESLGRFPANTFHWESLSKTACRCSETNLNQFESYETAYHKLMQELVNLQVEILLLAKGKSPIQKIFIDGGFADNQLFIHLLKQRLTGFDIQATKTPLGSAKGAAMVLNN